MNMTIADYERSLDTTAPADHDESERRLDDLLVYIRSQPYPVTVAKWFLESLAIEMMIPTATGDFDDPTRTLRTMARALMESFVTAGIEVPASRREIVKIIRDTVEDIARDIRDWD